MFCNTHAFLLYFQKVQGRFEAFNANLPDSCLRFQDCHLQFYLSTMARWTRALREGARRQLVLQWISHRVIMGASHVATFFPSEDVTWAMIARIARHKFTSLTRRNISASETRSKRKTRSRIGRLKRMTSLQFSPAFSWLTAPEFALSIVGRRSVPCQENSRCALLCSNSSLLKFFL